MSSSSFSNIDPDRICPHCEKILSSAGKCREHVKAVHEKAKPIQCAQPGCDHTSAQRGNMLKHMQTKHGLAKDVANAAMEAVNPKKCTSGKSVGGDVSGNNQGNDETEQEDDVQQPRDGNEEQQELQQEQGQEIDTNENQQGEIEEDPQVLQAAHILMAISHSDSTPGYVIPSITAPQPLAPSTSLPPSQHAPTPPPAPAENNPQKLELPQHLAPSTYLPSPSLTPAPALAPAPSPAPANNNPQEEEIPLRLQRFRGFSSLPPDEQQRQTQFFLMHGRYDYPEDQEEEEKNDESMG